MDYEEKYKHALGLAKQVYDTTISKQQKENIEIIFPELRESEDERIREKIIATIHLYYGESLEDEAKEIIAWLEKQGTFYTKRDVDDAYVEGMAFAKNELEKQKPTWSEKDERAFHHVLSVLEEYSEEHPSNSKFVCNWLKSIKARMGGDKV